MIHNLEEHPSQPKQSNNKKFIKFPCRRDAKHTQQTKNDCKLPLRTIYNHLTFDRNQFQHFLCKNNSI